MKTFVMFLVCLFISFGCGIAFGFVLNDAPSAQKANKLREQLNTVKFERDQYRQRCIEWNHYVWRLQENRYNSVTHTQEIR